MTSPEEQNNQIEDYINQIIQNQLDENNRIEKKDKERQEYISKIANFNNTFKDKFKECKEENQNYLNFNTQKTYEDLDICTNGALQLSNTIHDLNLFFNNIIYNQEDYCISNCKSNFPKQITEQMSLFDNHNPFKTCIKDCISNSYNFEKGYEKEICKVIDRLEVNHNIFKDKNTLY